MATTDHAASVRHADFPDPMCDGIERILRDLFTGIGAQRVMVRVQEWPGGQCPAVVQVTAPGVPPAPDDPDVDFSRAPTFLAVKDGAVLVQPDVVNAEQPATPPHLVDYYGIRAQMLHPLRAAGTFVGLLAVHEVDDVRAWSEQDSTALAAAAFRIEAVLDEFAPLTSMLGERRTGAAAERGDGQLTQGEAT